MTNITALRPNTAPAKSTSPLMFTAWERPLYYKGATGTEYNNTAHKALVRMLDDKPVVLNVVGESYKVVQNSELFDLVEEQLHKALTTEQLDKVVIKDEIAYGGAECFRTYRFPNIHVPTPENNLIHFKVGIRNGFGSGAIKIAPGSEDQICTNGMVRFMGEATYAKHTKGLSLSKFDHIITRAIDVFWKERDKWKALQKMAVSDERVHTWLIEQFEERLGNKLFYQYNIERASRGGRNLWALHSALTYYASHADGEFSLRNTGNDHQAHTMMKRQLLVSKIVEDVEFMRLAA